MGGLGCGMVDGLGWETKSQYRGCFLCLNLMSDKGRGSRVDEIRMVPCLQNVGMIIIFAPPAISSRNASGKARSQHIRRPTGPRGVWITSWGSWVLEVRCGRSGCL